MPNNRAVVNNKPLNERIDPLKGTEQFYTVNWKAGQPMGLLLALTYNVAGTVTTSRT